MKKYLGNKAMIILFIAPVMLFMIVMVFYPLVVLLRNSFTTWDGLNPATFNGIKNYVRLFKDPLFYTGLKNGIIYAAIQTCYQIPIATLLAFAVKSVSKGEKKFFRIAYYIPAVLSVTVVCQLWVAIYDADYGLINKIFEALGLAYRQNWLSGNDTAIRAIAFVGTWQYAGYQFILLLSAANSVPNDYFEAALLDGCSKPKAHIRITIPLMQEAYKYCLIIAITGGDLGATLDGQSIDTYRAVPVNAGQTLRFTMLRTGCRAFVAFAGGLDIPVVMGSRSTDMKAKIGGYQGRKLQKDDVIAFRAPKTDLKNLGVRHISPEFVPRAEYKLRVVLGPQDDAFTELGAMTFLSSVYTLTPEFDRMGCRLDGELIEHIKDGNIISDGIAFGAIQVPSAGKPIIMLADRQTTGGYTKIANVISADFRILAQLKAGDRVRFEKVSITTAQEALLAQRAALRCLRGAMNR